MVLLVCCKITYFYWTLRALDKREYLMMNFLISSQSYVVTPHLNHLVKMVQMRGHNICFYAELTKIIPNYHQILPLT